MFNTTWRIHTVMWSTHIDWQFYWCPMAPVHMTQVDMQTSIIFFWSTLLSHKVKIQYLHFRSQAKYFLFFRRKFLKCLADDQSSSITKGSIYKIRHIMYLNPFSMEVDWQDIKWKYLPCFIFVDTAFLLLGQIVLVSSTLQTILDHINTMRGISNK